VTRVAGFELPIDVAAATAAAAARSTFPLVVEWHPLVSSTMDLARLAAEGGAPEGLVIVADAQTAGRGRRGRLWSSPPGAGAYVSFVLRPPETMRGRPLSLLTLAAGVATRTAIARASGLAPNLKWPNDLLCGRRKLAGILAEASGLTTTWSAVVLGVGVNLWRTAHPEDVEARATSIEAELGRRIDRAKLLEELLVAVPAAYEELRAGGADDILRAWRAAAPSAVDARVEWDGPGGLVEGLTAGVADDGALLIRSADGLTRVTSGEIRWL
jgi:BirA family biotin operon repressor/biotin-[acetyl-CoA-carboxylase] ligase